MLFNDSILFIHVPKTGGMATTSHLIDILPGPTYYTAPKHDADLERPDRDVRFVTGSRHETLDEAQAVLHRLGRDLSEFSLIIAGSRNPYALEVSRYAYLLNGHAVDAGFEQDLAMSSDFTTFVRKSDEALSAPINRYYTAGGRTPETLRVVRLEHLDDDLSGHLAEIGLVAARPVPMDNQSIHDDYRSYYTQASEEAVYRRYRWVFDQGWYERMDASESWTPSQEITAAHKLPVFGCLTQVGPTAGAYSDGWIGDELRFRVSGHKGADYLTIEAHIPEGAPQDLSMQIGRDVFQGDFGCGPITWTVPCFIPPATPTLVTVTPSCTWVPAERIDGSHDARSLSFVLARVTFSSSTPGRVSIDDGESDWDGELHVAAIESSP
jgi:hypothetical protein